MKFKSEHIQRGLTEYAKRLDSNLTQQDMLNQVISWLCLYLPHEELPKFFKDKHYLQENASDIIIVHAPTPSNIEKPTEVKPTEPSVKPTPTTVPTKKPAQDDADDKKAQARWIMSYMVSYVTICFTYSYCEGN
jgi:hypothetical protein